MKKYVALYFNRVFLVEKSDFMYSLLIDSHGKELILVIYKNNKVIFEDITSFNNQSKIIIPKIIDILHKENLGFQDLQEIIVVNGPGSFTGIRIGVTIAKTLAYCLDIPIKSISTIKLLAINAEKSSDYSIAVPDQKGFFIGEFNNHNELINNYFYISNSSFNDYNKNHQIIENINIDYNNIYKCNCLTNENCYTIKPLYIKKIEVEK